MAIVLQFVNLRLMKAPISLLLSGLSLMRYFDWIDLLVIVPAAAFVGLLMTEFADKFSNYRAAIVQTIRRDS